MVSVDKSYATTSTWKPSPRVGPSLGLGPGWCIFFMLTINYTQPNPDYNNIITLVSLTLSKYFGVMRVQQLIENVLNKRSARHANKSTLVARGADTQLDLSRRRHLTANISNIFGEFYN